MKHSMQLGLFGLAVAGVLGVGQVVAAPIEFIGSEGYANGALTNNVGWAGGGEGANIVDIAGVGHDGALGLVRLGTTTNEWIEGIYSNSVDLSANGTRMTLASKFRYDTLGTLPPLQGTLYSLMFYDEQLVGGAFIRVGLRRRNLSAPDGSGSLQFWTGFGPGGAGTLGSGNASETNVNLTATVAGTSDWLLMTATLSRGATTNDWTVDATLINLATSNQLLSSSWDLDPLPALTDDPTMYGAMNSSMFNTSSHTTNRIVDTFEVTSRFVTPPPDPVTIIGGALGNGDFQATATNTLNQTYSLTPHWFNAQGTGSDEEFNFTFNSQMGGSTDPAHTSAATQRGAMPFTGRTSVNDTGYTIAAAGEVFGLRYDFGAGGGLATWIGAETNHTFLFTADAPVDGSLVNSNMTRLGGDDYPIARAGDGQWTVRTVTNLYTTTAADVGKTVYLGIEFEGGNNLFPRIDLIHLYVTPVAPSAGPTLSVAQNGGNVEVSWESAIGSSYQVRTNSVLNDTWGDYGSAIVGDGSTRTEPVPAAGDELYIHVEAQ